MNKEQQELLDDAYKNYLNKCLDKKWMKENVFFDGSSNHHLYLKEELINKIKTDDEFVKKWGLKIEERELSLEERINYKKKRDGIARTFASYTHQMLNNSNIPTKRNNDHHHIKQQLACLPCFATRCMVCLVHKRSPIVDGVPVKHWHHTQQSHRKS